MQPAAPENERVSLHAARFGVTASAVLMALQFAIGSLTGSHAIVADGAHTLVDLLVDALLFLSIQPRARQLIATTGVWALRIPSAVCTTLPVLVGSVLLLQGLADTPASAQTLSAAAAPGTTQSWALLTAVLIIAIREYTARRLSRAARAIAGSDSLAAGVLTAGAWHARIDALSACAAAAGAAGTIAGLGSLDQIASTLIGAIMVGTGVLPKDSPVRECLRRCRALAVRLRSAR